MTTHEEIIKKLQELLIQGIKIIDSGAVISPPPVDPVDPTDPVKPAEQGVILHGGWGANPDPNTWKSTEMVNAKYKGKWKIIDNKNINVMQEFSTKDNADKMIAWTITNYKTPTEPTDPTKPVPDAGKDKFGIKMLYASKEGGKTIYDWTVRSKERNYASGKPSEWSCEYTAKTGTPPLNEMEVTYYVKINGFKTHETDTLSTKIIGPGHTDGDGKYWYIFELETDGNSEKNFETEEPHPINHDNHQKVLFKVGESIVGKWIGVKVITYLINGGKDRRLEHWFDFPIADINNPPNNWRMYIGFDDVGQLDHGHWLKPSGDLVTCRIDGVKEESLPEFKYASVREITQPKPTTS